MTASTPCSWPLLVVHRRDAAAAGADHDRALLDQAADRPNLEDSLGLWAGDDSAELVSVRRDGPTAGGLEALRGLPVVDRPDRLGGVAERRVVAVHLDHRQQRGERLLGGQQVAEFLLDDVADHRLGLRAEHVERVRRNVVVCRGLQRQQADLRTVAVRDDDLVAGGDAAMHSAATRMLAR